MDKAAVLARIEARLTEMNLSADAASRLAGKPDAIRNLRRAVKENRRQGVTVGTLDALAKVLETSSGWLIDGQDGREAVDQVIPKGRPVSIPIVGKVAAGVFREVVEHTDGAPEYIFDEPDPEFPNARQMAFTVEGDSLNALRPRPVLDGDELICVDFDDTGLPLIDGMIVVLERTRDGGLTREWSAKQVEVREDRTEFHPRSHNASFKPIIVYDDPNVDTGEQVTVLGLVRRTSYALPRPALGRKR